MRILTFTSLFPNKMNPELGIFILRRTAPLAQRAGNVVEVVAPVPYVPNFLKGTARGSVASIPITEEIGNLQVHHPRYPLIPRVSMPLHGLLMYAGCLGYVKRLHEKYSFDCIDAHYVYPDGMAAVLTGKISRRSGCCVSPGHGHSYLSRLCNHTTANTLDAATRCRGHCGFRFAEEDHARA